MEKESYWSSTKNVPSTLRPHPLLPRMVAGGASLLDLGCGEGRTMAGFAEATGLLCGVDYNAGALARAAKHCPQGLFACADVSRLPFADKRFDVSSMHAVMTLLIGRQTRLAALREIRRVTRKRLFIADFLLTREDPYYAARYARGEEETGEPGSFVVLENGRPIYTAHHYALDELIGLLEEAGFGDIEAATGKVRTRSGNVINGATLAAAPREPLS